MASITKMKPSGSTNGRNTKIAATATAGTLFHTADATALDEIWMFLSNTDSVERKVTVEFGGVTSPDDHLIFNVPALTTILAIPGVPLTGSVVCRAFCAAANVVNMAGWVNRVTP